MKKTLIIIIFTIVIISVAIISNFISSELDGKTIAFLGDSLMAGYGNNFKSFDYYFNKNLPNSKFINNSKGGSTITDNTGTDNIIIKNQVETLTGYPEIILFDGGANDIIDYAIGFLDTNLKKEIGTIDTNTNEPSKSNTVMADFEEIIFELKNRFPDAKLCYVQLFLIDDPTIDKITIDESKKPEIKSRRDELFKQIKLACDKWGVYYIDVSDKFIDTGTKYRQDDWIHLKEEGYQYITPYIIKKLKNI